MSPDLGNDLFYLVHDVAHMMRIGFDQSARRWGMTRAQCVVLIHIHKHPGMTQNEMASLCEIEPITVARLVDRLQAGGYVERRSDPSDRRINRLHLLPAADAVIERIRQGRQAAVSTLLEGQDPADLEAVVSVLTKLKAKLASGCMSRSPVLSGDDEQ